jgi:hypothetical protein
MVLLDKVSQKVELFKESIMARQFADDDGKLRIFGSTLEEMRANRRATGETFPSKFTKKTLPQSTIDNLQPKVASRIDFSDEKMGPKYPKKVTKKEVTVEGDIGSVDRNNPDVIGPDMGKVNKEAKSAREFSATEMAQNLMSPGYNKKKGGAIKAKKMATGGKVSQLAKANGIAVRGKSRGRIV